MKESRLEMRDRLCVQRREDGPGLRRIFLAQTTVDWFAHRGDKSTWFSWFPGLLDLVGFFFGWKISIFLLALACLFLILAIGDQVTIDIRVLYGRYCCGSPP
jgi:hypothetical protein